MGEDKASNGKVSWKDWVIALVGLATLLSTTYQFYFREVVREDRKPTALAIDARLERAGERDGIAFVRVRVQASNPTDRRIYVPALWYSMFAFGVDVEPCGVRVDWTKMHSDTDRIALTRYNPGRTVEIVAQRRLFGDRAWWEPKDITNFEDIVAVPLQRFDFLKLFTTYVHGRKVDSLHEDHMVAWTTRPDGEWLPLVITRAFHEALKQAAPTDAAASAVLHGKVVAVMSLSDPLRRAYGLHNTQWAREAEGGINYYEVGLGLASAARGSAVGSAAGAGLERSPPQDCPR